MVTSWNRLTPPSSPQAFTESVSPLALPPVAQCSSRSDLAAWRSRTWRSHRSMIRSCGYYRRPCGGRVDPDRWWWTRPAISPSSRSSSTPDAGCSALHYGFQGLARPRGGAKAGGAVDREPAGEVGLDPQVVGEDRPDLQLDGVVAAVRSGRGERVPAALLVQIDQPERVGAVGERDQGAQQRGAEAGVDECAVHRVQIGDQAGDVLGARLADQPGEH